jgi:hypothetical protein
MANQSERYLRYLDALLNPFQKLTKLEFLQPDNSVAFFLSNANGYRRGYNPKYQSSALVQQGTLSVSFQNGARRKASITLSDIDNAFEYNVNNIWFGQKIRLSMGLVLPDGTDFYLPQMVGLIKNPQSVLSENQKTVTFPLVDKWANLDGSLFGKLTDTYTAKQSTAEYAVYTAIANLLKTSIYDHKLTDDINAMIDNIAPIFTNYYDGKNYAVLDGDGSQTRTASMTEIPFDISENGGSNFAQLLLQFNDVLAGIIGYDQTGALRLEPSQTDINDIEKPVLWQFTQRNSTLSQISETIKNDEVYNDVIIVGGGNTDGGIWGRASNNDPNSDTSISAIGLKTYRETKANYFNSKQCLALAEYYLKRKTVLQKSVNITSSQMFHLVENQLVSVQRTDKPGSPTERHLINSFSLPIGETGAMTINATSVTDIPNFTVTSSSGV